MLRRAVGKLAILVLVAIGIIAIISYENGPAHYGPPLAVPSENSISPNVPQDPAARKLCGKFLKLSLRDRVISSYSGIAVTVGPQWDALSFEDKKRIAFNIGKCLYLSSDKSEPRLLGFYDYHSGKRIGHLDPDGIFEAE